MLLAATLLATSPEVLRNTSETNFSIPDKPREFTMVNGPNPQGRASVRFSEMDSAHQVPRLEVVDSVPASKSFQMDNEAEDNGTESDSDADDDKMPVQHKLSDRRRNQHSKFSSWLVADWYLDADVSS